LMWIASRDTDSSGNGIGALPSGLLCGARTGILKQTVLLREKTN
jgi:hypothetical protein